MDVSLLITRQFVQATPSNLEGRPEARTGLYGLVPRLFMFLLDMFDIILYSI